MKFSRKIYRFIVAGGSMSFKPRASLLSLAIIIGLVFSAVSPTIVHADGDTTPEPTSTEVSPTEPAPTEVTSDPTKVAATPQPTDEVVATDPASTADPQTTEAAAPVVKATDSQSTEVTSNPDEATATPAPTEEVAPVDQATTTDPQSTDAAAPDTGSSNLSDVPNNTVVTVLDTNGNAEPLVTQAAADAIATSDPIWCPGGQS